MFFFHFHGEKHADKQKDRTIGVDKGDAPPPWGGARILSKCAQFGGLTSYCYTH